MIVVVVVVFLLSVVDEVGTCGGNSDGNCRGEDDDDRVGGKGAVSHDGGSTLVHYSSI